jgi:hypothetical protein
MAKEERSLLGCCPALPNSRLDFHNKLRPLRLSCNDQQNVGSESFATWPFYGLLHSASWFHANEPSNIGCLYVVMEPLTGYEHVRLARALHGQCSSPWSTPQSRTCMKPIIAVT